MRMEAYWTVAEDAAPIRVGDEMVQRACRSGEVGARQCAPDTIRTHRKHIHRYVCVLLGDAPAVRITWREAATERALGRAVARLPATPIATRDDLSMAVMSWTRFLLERGAARKAAPRR